MHRIASCGKNHDFRPIYGVLLIDGITVFSLERGYVRRHDGVNVSSPGTDG